MKKQFECPVLMYYETIDTPQGKQKKVLGKKPVFKTRGAACADVAVPTEVVIDAHSSVLVDLWIGFDIPEGKKIIMYPRSSLLITHGLMQPVSIIDSDYKGHVHVPLFNLTNSVVKLEAGERVAQIECVAAMPHISDWECNYVERDQNGFGGTGKC